jgi:hypothetical protein
MKPIHEQHVLRRMFRGLVESAFCTEVGICDPELTDYITDLLVNFAHVDAIYALRDCSGKRLEQLADMLIAVEADANVGGDIQFVRHRHMGDFALFWSGVYPEQARRSRGLAFKDRMIDYVKQGKRAYSIASNLANRSGKPSPSLLNRLSREFESCCHGLGLVRQGWEEPTRDGLEGPGHLLY